jgi:hypothetical protein
MRQYFITVRLQPQMKKYRCPWYVSTTNHNILYFVGISRTCSLNTAVCLWKAANGLAWREVARSVLHSNRGKIRAPARSPYHNLSVVLRWPPHKAQNWCRMALLLCELWRSGTLPQPNFRLLGISRRRGGRRRHQKRRKFQGACGVGKSHGINENVRFLAAEKGQMFAWERPFDAPALVWNFAIF